MRQPKRKPAGRKIIGAERAELGAELRQRYEDDPLLSIAKLAQELGRSPSFVGNLLKEAGTRMRSRAVWPGHVPHRDAQDPVRGR